MREKLKALWAKVPSFKQVGTSLDASLQKVPGMAQSEVTTIVGTPPYQSPENVRQSRKTPKKSWFQETFRGEERLKLEAYTMASTQAEQDAILKTMKPDMV